MRKKYTKEFLISELKRFYNENGRSPTSKDMKVGDRFPFIYNYINCFKTWNNALKAANLPLNQYQYHPKLDGTETCSYCGKRADEIVNFRTWLYDEDGIRYCHKHGLGRDYVKGQLDINSTVGQGRAGEILVAKVLNINKDKDCNRISCGYKFDLKHDDYKKIDVKTCLLYDNYNSWIFKLKRKKDADTYICLGFDSDRKNILHVWIVPNEDKIRNLVSLNIKNTYCSLTNRSKWEIDSKPYNDMWQTMKLDNCKIMVDKSKYA